MERFLEFSEPGASGIRRSCGCGRTRGRSSCRSCLFHAEIRKIVCTTNAMVILSPQDDQARELLLCVVNSVAGVAVHDVWIGGETPWSRRVAVWSAGVRGPLLAEGLGERSAETLVVGFQLTDPAAWRPRRGGAGRRRRRAGARGPRGRWPGRGRSRRRAASARRSGWL